MESRRRRQAARVGIIVVVEAPVVLVAAVAARDACALTRPEHATRASTHDDDPRNDGSTDAPQVRHTVHTSVTQADAIGGPLAKADALTCSTSASHAATSMNALEAATCAVEHKEVSMRTPERKEIRTC
jgi:hypothetical protein